MVSFVYFDVGGVVMRDFSKTPKWQQLKRDLGIPVARDDEFEAFFQAYEPQVCCGLDLESLVPLMNAQFGLHLPEKYSFLNDFVNRFESNPAIVPVITKIHRRCRVGLLTNLYPGMLEAEEKQGLLPEIAWEVVIDSSVVGCQKPERKIYEIAQSKAGVPKDQILFVDNAPVNIQAAKDFGWQTFLYDPTNVNQASTQLLHVYRSLFH
jgi:FMN phosphatase YigB (HAD superfamily)